MIPSPQLTHKSMHAMEKDGNLIRFATVNSFGEALLQKQSNK